MRGGDHSGAERSRTDAAAVCNVRPEGLYECRRNPEDLSGDGSMRIKTITCHDVYNVGASLQAYALVMYLRSLGHEAEIIDYKPDYLSNHYRLWGLSNPAYDKPVLRELYNLAKLPRRLKARCSKRKKCFDTFTRDYLPKTPRRYTSNDDLKRNPPEADVYFAGSDQIWNCFFQNGRDPAFYLDFAPEGCIKASYAASFATEDVAEEWKPQVRQWLSGLDSISVRESSGVEIVERLGIPGAVQVLDPVFLLPKEEWEQLAQPLPKKEPFIFLYDFDRNDALGKAVRDLADRKGWKVYSYLTNPYADCCFDQYGPLTFLSLVKDAQLVMSNSFHATAFSLIFKTNFWVINREEAINTRMRDLTRLVGVPERLLTDFNTDLLINVDWEKVKACMNYQIDQSKKYLFNITHSNFAPC